MPINIDPDAIYLVDELSKLIRVSEVTIRRYCRDKTLKAVKKGKQWYINGSSVLKYILNEKDISKQ